MRAPSGMAAGGALRALLVTVLLAAASLLALPARAHDVGAQLRMHAWVKVENDRLTLVARVPLELMLNVDLPKRGDGYLDLAQLPGAMPRALKAVERGLQLREDGRLLEARGGEGRVALPADTSFASLDRALSAIRHERLPAGTDVYWNQGWFDVVLEYPVRSPRASFALESVVAPGLGERLQMDLRFVTRDGDVRAYALSAGSGEVVLDPSGVQAFQRFVRSGTGHILGGADHLLFLLCLVLPFARVGWPLVGVVTAFTLGHAVTLGAAAVGLVPQAPWFVPLVETLIALSILWMAIENLVQPALQRRWLLALGFGLVHGFGFSFALGHEMQFAGDHLAVALLAFNVGIELGQLAVLLAVWPLLQWLRRRHPQRQLWWVGVPSVLAGHAALHWVAERWETLQGVPWPPPSAIVAGVAAAVLLVAGAWLAWRAWRPAPAALQREL